MGRRSTACRTAVCQCCGKEFEKKKPGLAPKFCSYECAYNSRRLNGWAWQAVSLHVFDHLGAKNIGRIINVHPMTILDVLKKAGVHDEQASRLRRYAEQATGTSPFILMAEAFEAEQSQTRSVDDDRLWRHHPEFIEWRRLEANRKANEWAKLHPEKLRERYRRNAEAKSNYFLATRLRTRIRAVLKGSKKSASTMELIGCSLDQFRLHLQSKFKKGMAWNNYGPVWHIDHIQPCNGFDLSKPEEQRKCFHFSNMQPMFASENISKGDKIKPCQPEFLLQMR